MTLLLIGDRTYSSWSLRGWLLFERWGLPFTTRNVPFDKQDVACQLAAHAPARTVPTAIFDDGSIVSDSLAIAEELATRYPDAAIWPSHPLARANARTMAAEMHSGFAALRSDCPMNLRRAYTSNIPGDAVRADLDRLEAIWTGARETCGSSGPWLCGPYCAADAFFAPVAARIAGYGLQVGNGAAAYVAEHLADPAFRRWRAMAMVRGEDLPWYGRDFPVGDWPGPVPLAACAADHGPSVNDACPYSGDPVTHFLEFDAKTYGFCNAFCRDKTVADPGAWPAFMALAAGKS